MALDQNALRAAWDAVQGHDMADWKGLMEKAIDAYLSALSRPIIELTGPDSRLALRIARLTDPDYRVVLSEERAMAAERIGTAVPFLVSEASTTITVMYRNWRGEVAKRHIKPIRIWFGLTKWHPEPQWLITALDVEKGAERDFALSGFGSLEDMARLDALRDNCWDLRCYDIPTGSNDYDVGWCVVGHWQEKPRERIISLVSENDPRAAIDTAIARKPSGANS